MLKIYLFSLFFASSCVEPLPPYPVVASDEDPGYCSENYPFDEPPEECESNSYGDCCTWNIEDEDGGMCRYDYCAFHSTQNCEWEIQLKECH